MEHIPCIVFTKVDSKYVAVSNPQAEKAVKSANFRGFKNLKDYRGNWVCYVVVERVK